MAVCGNAGSRLAARVRRSHIPAAMGGERNEEVDVSLSGAALLAQHEELLSIIEQMEQFLVAGMVAHHGPEHAQVVSLLGRLIGELETHFEAERRSLERDFEDDPEMRAVFQALDAEHPDLLQRFLEARRALELQVDLGEVSRLIGAAIERFRDHEAREDAYFVSQ